MDGAYRSLFTDMWKSVRHILRDNLKACTKLRALSKMVDTKLL